MKALLQRVSQASVSVDGQMVGEIGRGLLVLVGFEPTDTSQVCARMLERILLYRIFPDPQGKMNLGLLEAGGDLLLVSQFTLAADTGKGLRPGFSTAAAPALARALYDDLLTRAQARFAPAVSGRLAGGKFGADMQVALINDGPVTFLLESHAAV